MMISTGRSQSFTARTSSFLGGVSGTAVSNKASVFTAGGSLVAGLLSGGLLTCAFFFPASPPALHDISAHLKDAHALLDKNLLADAERSFLAILGADPGNPEALSHLGNVAFQQGDIERSLRVYDMALQQDPAYAHAPWDKGIALGAKGDHVGAIKAWEAFAQLFQPDSPDVVQVKKWIAEAQAQVDSAATSPAGRLKKNFSKIQPKRCLKTNPSSSRVTFLLCPTRNKENQERRAIDMRTFAWITVLGLVLGGAVWAAAE